MRNRSVLTVVSLLALLNACAAPADDNDDDAEDVGQSASALTSGPDLQITALTAPASSEGWLTVSTTLCNKGNADAGASVVGLTFADEMYPDYPIQIGSRPAPALAVGACASVPIDIMGPSHRAGVLSATADADRVVTERNEANNTRVGKRIAFGPLPDLQVTAAGAPPNIGDYTPGGWTATARICNKGSDRANPTYADFYLSADATITAADSFAGTAEVPPLEVGACADISTQVNYTYPAPTTPTVRMGVIVDAKGYVLELSEANNTRSTGPIGFGRGPDFIVSSFTTPASSDYDQHFFATTVKVCNQGTMPGYPPDIAIVHSTDTTIDPNTPYDMIVGRGYSMDGMLAENQCTTVTVNVDGPIFPIDSYGQDVHHYFAAVLDQFNTIPELQETNNVSAVKEVALGHGPDLVVSSIAAPATATWESFNTTVKVCNQGTRPSDTSQLRLAQSADATYEDTDLMLAGVDVAPLDAGKCRNVVVPTRLMTPPGSTTSVYLAAKIVVWTPELISTNNTRARAIAVTR